MPPQRHCSVLLPCFEILLLKVLIKRDTHVPQFRNIRCSDVCQAHELCYETAKSCAENEHYLGLKTNCMLESVHVLRVFERGSDTRTGTTRDR
jgi:hypothetical protein